ncbi:hypothetical protein N7489_004759, partial [Penicillium chrysogenum]|uniref:uncharacterized protein n=1 Tax=Penicillium chrysogenum TaxID=5076 RepID=UPI0024DF2F16
CELPTCKWQESCAEAGRADFRTVAISRTCTSHDGDHEKATTSHWKQFLDETSEGKLWEGSNGESSGVQGSFYPPTATAQVGAPAHALTEIRSHSIPKLKFIDNFKAAKGAATPGEDGLRTLIWERLWKYLGNITTRIFPSSIELGNHAQRRRSARLALPKAYRPTLPLNALWKLLQMVMARRLPFFAEHYGLLPDTQFGGRPGRTTRASSPDAC